ncbi:MAG: envelope stress response membrane protein PspB [Candidatus Hydrogenedentota bacterium]
MKTILTAAATPLIWTIGVLEMAVIAMVLVIVAAPIVVIIWLLTKRNKSVYASATPEDEEILYEMNEGLQRMEERIDALETLLADDTSKGEHK